MTNQTQTNIDHALEIIKPHGEVGFYSLGNVKRLTNIGRHPDNDIILETPEVPPFLAVLDHREKPYKIILLADEGGATLNGQALSSQKHEALNNRDTLEVGGYTIILLEPGASPPPSPPSQDRPSPTPPVSSTGVGIASAPPAPSAAPATSAAPQPQARPSAPPTSRDKSDAYIITELTPREATIDVEQTAQYVLSITNSGPQVAAFSARLQGVPSEWVTITPGHINLNDGETGKIYLSVSPPRHPTSQAATYPLDIVVTSAEYPEHRSCRGAQLTLNPYYAFTVGKLTPEEVTLRRPQTSGQANFIIANQGNNATRFQVKAAEAKQSCNLDLLVPGNDTRFAGQAEFQLPAGTQGEVQVLITPHQSPARFWRTRDYVYTVTAGPAEGTSTTPREMRGQAHSRPRIGKPISMAISAMLIIIFSVSVISIFRPSIKSFTLVTQSQLEESVRPKTSLLTSVLGKLGGRDVQESTNIDDPVRAGDPFTLQWHASPYANLTLDIIPNDPEHPPESIPIDDAKGERPFVARSYNANYKLKSTNLLARLLPFLANERVIAINVNRIDPVIRDFTADKTEVPVGSYIGLTWVVTGANDLKIVTDPPLANGNEIALGAELAGERTVELHKAATFQFVLHADNLHSATHAENRIEVEAFVPPTPTPTPLPPPIVRSFDVQPKEIALGEEVTIRWDVAGADTVTIDPIGAVGLSGPYVYEPDKEGTQIYTLHAYNGEVETAQQRQIIVGPAPEAPTIRYFDVKPKAVVRGDGQPIELCWLVEGEYTNIEISGPLFGRTANLPAEGPLTVNVNETTFFILTAFNNDLSASDRKEIQVKEPTPTPLPTPTSPPPPNIIFFKAESGDDPPDINAVVPTDKEGEYIVKARSYVLLSWEVENADKVTLLGGGQQSPQSPIDSRLVTVVSDETYELRTENEAGSTSQYVKFIIDPLGDPAPPTILDIEGTDVLTITWQYGPEDAKGNEIVGFRIRYASIPGNFNFLQDIAIDREITEVIQYHWTDTKNNCGDYRMTTLYIHPRTSQLTETDAYNERPAPHSCSTPLPH